MGVLRVGRYKDHHDFHLENHKLSGLRIFSDTLLHLSVNVTNVCLRRLHTELLVFLNEVTGLMAQQPNISRLYRAVSRRDQIHSVHLKMQHLDKIMVLSVD